MAKGERLLLVGIIQSGTGVAPPHSLPHASAASSDILPPAPSEAASWLRSLRGRPSAGEHGLAMRQPAGRVGQYHSGPGASAKVPSGRCSTGRAKWARWGDMQV